MATMDEFWARLDSYWEGRALETWNPSGAKSIRAAVTGSFGAISDYDRNQRVIFLLTNLSSGSSANFFAGYFDPNDALTADTTTGCTGGGSNGADMLYLMDPADYASKGYLIDTVVNEELPSVMSHELQHDALFNARCCTGHVPCDPGRNQSARCGASSDGAEGGDLWLNEGLSMVAEDVAGFGLHTASGRNRVGNYLSCASSNLSDPCLGSHTCHENASLTAWPTSTTPYVCDSTHTFKVADPYGNYGGVHGFLRWHLDQQAKAGAGAPATFLRGLVGAQTPSKQAVAAGSGLSFEEGLARFAAATLFSGWSADPVPAWDFASGVPWSPWHLGDGTLPWPSYATLGATSATSTLRVDGWRAWQTGAATGGDAVLTVTTRASARPRLVVSRVAKALGTP
jgi:hypothetical protein